jgi:hypothetical protein
MRRKAASEFECRSGDLLQTLLYEMVAGQLESFLSLQHQHDRLVRDFGAGIATLTPAFLKSFVQSPSIGQL